MIGKAFEEEEIYAQIPNSNLIQLKFIEDFDESTQDYKDPETVKEEGEIVAETANSIKDFGTHYDEVADKPHFHRDLPLSSYQKIVDETDDHDFDLPQSTVSLQN